MALEVTPVYRNLRTRVTFLGLEAEDLFAILALAVVANILGRFLEREMFGLRSFTLAFPSRRSRCVAPDNGAD